MSEFSFAAHRLARTTDEFGIKALDILSAPIKPDPFKSISMPKDMLRWVLEARREVEWDTIAPQKDLRAPPFSRRLAYFHRNREAMVVQEEIAVLQRLAQVRYN